MAFINGSPIDASLMKLDYSPLVEASKFQGQALAQFGKNFVKGIEDYKKKKEKKIEDAEFAEAIKPFVTNIAGGDEAEADKITRMLVNRPELFKQFKEVKESSDAVDRAAMTQDILSAVSDGSMSMEDAALSGVDLDTLSGFANLNTQRLEDENIQARTGASNRSNQPKNTTYEQVRGVAKVMEEQFPDVNVDEKTGALFVKNTGSRLTPFDSSNDAANVPGSITSMPGFEEWRKSKMSASARGEFDSSQYKMLPNPQ